MAFSEFFMLKPTPAQLKALARMEQDRTGDLVLFVRRDSEGIPHESCVKHKRTYRGAIRVCVDETRALLASSWVKPSPETLAGKPVYYVLSQAGRELVESARRDPQQIQMEGGL